MGASVLRSRTVKARGARRRWRGTLLLNGVLSFPVQPRQLARLELMDLTLVAPLQLKRLFCAAGLRLDAERAAQPCPAAGSSPSPARIGLSSVGIRSPAVRSPGAAMRDVRGRANAAVSPLRNAAPGFVYQHSVTVSLIARRIGSPRPAQP